MSNIRRFVFIRNEDLSGVSGTGEIAEGCELSNGKIVFSWLTNLGSVAVYDNIKTLIAIHGHEGRGHVEWLDPDPTDVEPPKKKTKK